MKSVFNPRADRGHCIIWDGTARTAKGRYLVAQPEVVTHGPPPAPKPPPKLDDASLEARVMASLTKRPATKRELSWRLGETQIELRRVLQRMRVHGRVEAIPGRLGGSGRREVAEVWRVCEVRG